MDQLDILYTPLDVPDRPDTDLNAFMRWAREAYVTEEQKIIRKQLSKGTAHNKLDPNGEYAWDMTYARFGDRWCNGFDQQFPALADYSYKTFGIQLHELATVLFLPLRNTVKGEAFWHNDVDETGFRYYLWCENPEENPLVMRRCTYPHMQRPRLPVPIHEDDPRIAKERLVCRMRSSTQAYYLNNIRAVHAPTIYSTEPTLRIACLIKCKNEYQPAVRARSKDLIVRSAEKYSEYALLW